MKFEIKGEEVSTVVFELKKEDGDMEILANGILVAWFNPSGELRIRTFMNENVSPGLPLDANRRIIIKGYTRND